MNAQTHELTQLEKDVLINGIAGSGFYDCDYDEVWSDCITDTCRVTTKDQISGVVASLVKKGLVETSNPGTAVSVVKFTLQGLRTLEQIKWDQPTKKAPKKAPKNPQDIVRMNAIGSCLSAIHDVRFRFDLTDEERDVILRDIYKELGAIYDSLKQSLEG